MFPMPRFLFGITALTLILTGCGSVEPSSRQNFSNLAGGATESRLRIGEQLTVRLDTGGNRLPDTTECVIDENGEISLPLIGRVQAAGATASELAERIQASYVPRYYVRCNATVLATVRFFYVGGEVRAPSRYPWTEDTTLMKAINTAGGFSDYASKDKVEITRGKGKQVFNCDEIRQHPSKDVPILPGDTIYVPRSIF
jgi:protein involved in polysaccharide export with SLBB domain